MDLLQKILIEFPTDPLELAGLVSGLLCVFLLVKENIWVWPVGLFYALVSVFVFLFLLGFLLLPPRGLAFLV